MALAFMLVLAAINLRGVGESVKFNVVLTLVEMTALAHRHRHRHSSSSPAATPTSAGSWSSRAPTTRASFMAVTVATAIAFFSMVGFEDSVNMVEETQDPMRDLPAHDADRPRHRRRHLHAGRDLRGRGDPGRRHRQRRPTRRPAILLDVVKAGAPDLPIDKIFPFLTRLRRRQHRADQHADGEPAASTAWPSRTCCRAPSARCSRAVARRGPRSSSPRCWRSA